jgi:hypothetical protein
MALPTTTREWARLGAKTRLAEIDQERLEILRQYPEFRGTGGRTTSPAARGPRKKLSAAAKRKLSAGMRKYWARRKAEAAKG